MAPHGVRDLLRLAFRFIQVQDYWRRYPHHDELLNPKEETQRISARENILILYRQLSQLDVKLIVVIYFILRQAQRRYFRYK